MILLDSDILSTFSKLDMISLLFEIFEGNEICISINVFNEIKKAEEEGYEFANKVFYLIDKGKIKVVSPSIEELSYTLTLPISFGDGERDSVAIAKKRAGSLVTNEKRVANYCKNNGIKCFWLDKLLRILWKDKILTKDEVRKLIEEIEEKDNIVIVSKDEIFVD